MPELTRAASKSAEDLEDKRRRTEISLATTPGFAGGTMRGRVRVIAKPQVSALQRRQVGALQRLAGNGAVQSHLSGGRHGRVQRVGTIISAQTKAGTSAHPTLTKAGPNNAEAVSEAQQKLATSPGGPATLPATGVFDSATEAAVKAFRLKNSLSDEATVDKATWDLLDAQGKSSVGRVERAWQQLIVPGSEGGKNITQGMTSKYSYKIDDKQITVTVGINFVPDKKHPPKNLAGVVSKWSTRILGRWNLFKAVKTGATESRDIVFEIVPSGGNTVNVIDAMVGSDAANWSVPDNENDNGPAHEFGHMIGLEDEYKRGIDDYTRLHPETAKKDIDAAKGAFFGGEQYTDEKGMMGTGALSGHADKSADPEPRHVREFVSFVEKFLGGTWEAAKK